MTSVLVSAAVFLVCSDAVGEEFTTVPSVQCVGGPFGLKLPADGRKLRSLGRLLREQVSEVERWDGYTATRKTLYFDGLELGIVEISNDPTRLMITHAEVSNPKWNHLVPFKLGQPIATARSLLGSYAQGDEGLVKTYSSDGDAVRFQSAAGALVGLSYSCYSAEMGPLFSIPLLALFAAVGSAGLLLGDTLLETRQVIVLLSTIGAVAISGGPALFACLHQTQGPLTSLQPAAAPQLPA